MLVPLLFSPFLFFWTFLKAAGRRASLSRRYNARSTRSTLNSAEINTERSRLHTNWPCWHFTRTVCHYSLILKSLRSKPKLTEGDGNGFMKVLYYLLHLWIRYSLSENLKLCAKPPWLCFCFEWKNMSPGLIQRKLNAKAGRPVFPRLREVD